MALISKSTFKVQKMKTMNISKIWRVLFLLLVVATACDDKFEEINTNPNAVTEIDDEYLFANAVLQTLRGTNNVQIQFPFASQYAHIYSGQSTAIYIDRYYDNFTNHEYDYLFKTFYYSPIRSIKEVLRLTAPGADNENEVRHAMAQVVSVMNFIQLADAFGSIPYADGGVGQEGYLYPEYDAVEFIYKDALDKLTTVVSLLSTADPAQGYPGADPFFDNDLEKWSRFANSLRLRLAMRIRFADEITASAIIKECLTLPLIEENDQNVRNENEDTDISEFRNPFFEHYDFWKWKMSELFIETLKTQNDPRLEVFATPNENGEYIGLPNGLSDGELSNWKMANVSDPSDNLVGKAAPIYYMSAAEVWLLRAEAALFDIVEGDANVMYQTAIQKSLEQWNVDENLIEDYLGNNTIATLSGSQEEQFKQISTQLWIAVLPNAMEGWNNIRRTGYPVLPERSAPEFDLGVTGGKLPTRCRYPASEVNINNQNYLNAVAEQGPDEITTPLWWDIRN
jgi:hypothetical protein